MGSVWLGGATPRSKKRDDSDIFGLGVSVTKHEREALKKTDKKTYYKVKESCIKGIENKFTQLKPIDENSPIDHFESVYSVVTRFDDLQQALQKNDLIDVFTIASQYKTNGSGPLQNAKQVDLFHNIRETNLATIQLANKYFIEYGEDYHGENVIWSGEKILNSCDSTLRDKLIESTRGWDEQEKGGPTYLKLLMGLIVATSEKSLRSLLDKVTQLKLTDFNGEDVNKAVSFLRGATLILRDNAALPNDFHTLVLKIFGSTSCEDFKSFVKLLEHNIELKVQRMTTDETLSLFEKKYTEMLGRNEWTPKSTTKDQGSAFSMMKSGRNARKLLCYNCGGIGHGLTDCKLPFDQDAIDFRKEVVLGNKRSDSASSNNRRNNDNNNNNNKSNKSKNGSGGRNQQKSPSNPLKVPPKRDESHEKSINGKKLHWCGKQGCCKWGDHKTCDHPESNNDNNNNGNPQGNAAAEDIGDDSAAPSDNATAGFLGASSLSGF